ncbi:MAG: SDR family oxidoreductase [Planctomycetota bacterium]
MSSDQGFADSHAVPSGDPTRSTLLEPKPQAAPVEPDLHKGKVAIVTGGGWNIGRAVALALAARGARVIISSRNQDHLDDTARAAQAQDLYVRPHRADLSVPEEVDALVVDVVGEEGKPDILCCLAGGFGCGQPVQQSDPAEWLAVVTRNLFTTYLCARAVLPHMLERQRGDILTCAGGGAFFPMVGVHATAYASAKAAICRFTDQLFVEVMHVPGIRVNCIEPGMTWSPRDIARIEAEEEATGRPHPLREMNHPPGDGAALACFLLSPEARSLNGRILSVDEDWWKDPDKVRQVAESDLYRLRRTFL